MITTFQDLYEALGSIPEKIRKESDLTYFDTETEELYPFQYALEFAGAITDEFAEGILDDGHPYLIPLL